MLDRIQVDPGVCEGRPTIRGLRITVSDVLSYLDSVEKALVADWSDFVEQGPPQQITEEQAEAQGTPENDPEHATRLSRFKVNLLVAHEEEAPPPVIYETNPTYPNLFDVVTYDAGALSEANAKAVVDAGKDYLFALKGEQRTMFKLATELLDPYDVAAQTVDALDNEITVTRSLTIHAVDPSQGYGDGKGPSESVWPHARAFLGVEYLKRRGAEVLARDARIFVTSTDPKRLTGEQWLLLIRSHWGVENNNHHTLDTAFAEDDRPWIEADPQGMVAVLILRRIAYTLLTLYRSVTLRSDEGRATRWKALLQSVRDLLIAATEDQLAGLRQRETAATP